MRVGIIGGGAAGLMCAATINEQYPELEVFLIEKNDSLGKKVIISGGGRCNLTTGLKDIKTILNKYPRGSKFLSFAMHHFSPLDVWQWFENHDVLLKCEEDLRVFPISNQGQDVVNAFEKIFSPAYRQAGKHQTKILFNHGVTKLEKENNQFKIYFKDQEPLLVDKVVLTLGGQAYRQTGSTGDGYGLAENLGHHITTLTPSLSALVSKESWVNHVAGLSFAKATFKAEGEKKYEFTGPFVFAHWGVSGPAVFAISALIAFEKISNTEPFKIYIDLLPDFSVDQILSKLKNFIELNPKKLFKHALHQLVPLSLTAVIIDQLNINPEKNNNEISKKELQQTVDWLKHLPLTIINRRAGDEFVTAGGIDLTEVNSKTMQSKLCPGLYFAGEILNIDGYTGGFNLQAAWTTGRLAGLNINTN